LLPFTLVPQISSAEWLLVNLVRQSASPIDATVVIERLAEANGWQPDTIKTILHRLVQKGALATDQIEQLLLLVAFLGKP
jgi:BlaI family penicillinase repressor